MSVTARDRAALLVLAAALLAAFGAAWLPGKTLFARDLTYLFHPMHAWTAENLQAGRMPLWNPYVSGGVPWLGQPQTGLFYPGNLLFWLFPFAGGLKLFSALHFFLSGLGGYLWARSSGGSPRAALAAGLLWSLNGFWRARVEFTPLLAVLAWTPWLALFVGASRAGPLALAGALAVTAGYWPQVLWSGLLALAAAGSLRRKGPVLRAAAGAAALAAAALFPGLELMARSDRAAGLAESLAGLYAFSPRHWLGLLWPWASAMPEQAYTGEKFFWTGCFFVGFVGAALAALAFARARGPRRWVWAGLFVLGAALSLGPATPLFRLLVWARVRYPGQQAFWMTGAVLAAAAAGARFWERGLSRRTASVLVGLLALELLVDGAGMAPVIKEDYFHRRPAWMAPAQEGPGRLFLAPRAVSDMSSHGRDLEDTWGRLREKGLSLSTLPYHVRNLNPLGFSLNPASTDRLLSDLYGRPSYEAARPLLDRLSVRWVAGSALVAGADLTLRGDGPRFLYERAETPRFPIPDGNRLALDAPPEGGAVPTAAMYDPGWTAAGRGAETVDDGGLLSLRAAPGEGKAVLLFRPRAFRRGLLLSLLAWTLLAAWALRRAACL